MEIGSIFLIIALLVLVGFFVGRPIFDKTAQGSDPEPSRSGDLDLSALLAERDRVLTALKELDFDHILEKIPDDEYPQQRSYLLQRGVEILKQIDAAAPVEQERLYEARLESDHEMRPLQELNISRTIANNGKLQTGYAGMVAVSTPEDELEVLIASRRRSREDKAAGFCPKCGSPHQVSDRFCPKCGKRMD